MRVTDNAAHPEAPALRNDYSRRQAFNANDTRFLLDASDGHWHLHDATTGRFIRVLNNLEGATDRLAGDAEPQWHPTDPDLLYFLPRDGIGMQIYLLDLKTSQVSVVADMGPQIQQHWPDASVASTRSEGSPSADGRYWCFMARAMVDNGSWPMRGVFTWDLQEQRIIGTLSQDGTPDHVSMSPSGKYCVVSHTTATGPGTRAYRRDFQAPYSDSTPDAWLQLHTTSEHSDIALDPQGRDVYVSVLKQSAIDTARESERGVIDIETLQHTQNSLIETIEQTLEIQREGRRQRQIAEQELQLMEGQLRDKLMAISNEQQAYLEE